MVTRARHFSLLRTLHVADGITLLNATLGCGAIFLAMGFVQTQEPARFVGSAVLLLGALVADLMDGAVARKRGQASLLGRELDSLSDVISFGVAPAVLGFAVGLNTTLDALALLFLVGAGVARLARFNVTAASLSGTNGKVRYYEGTPITFSLLLVVVLLWAVLSGAVGAHVWGGQWGAGPFAFHPLALMYVVSGCAMVSRTLRIPKP